MYSNKTVTIIIKYLNFCIYPTCLLLLKYVYVMTVLLEYITHLQCECFIRVYGFFIIYTTPSHYEKKAKPVKAGSYSLHNNLN